MGLSTRVLCMYFYCIFVDENLCQGVNTDLYFVINNNYIFRTQLFNTFKRFGTLWTIDLNYFYGTLSSFLLFCLFGQLL